MPKKILLLVLTALVGCSSTRPSKSATEANTAVLSMDPGDLSGLHPIETPKPHVELLAHSVPQEDKDRTHLFFINGLDPYYLANFRGQCQYMKSLGYNKCYCGQMNHVGLFRQKIQQIRKDESQANIVLVGYSFGANSVRTLANQLKEDGIRVDLLIYLGGDTIKDVDTSRPENVTRVVNINGHGSILLGYDLFIKGSDIQGAVNHRLDARHFLLPTRAAAAELLVKHVVELAPNAPTESGVAQATWRNSTAARGQSKEK